MVPVKNSLARTSMFPVSGALQLQASGAMKERPISCTNDRAKRRVTQCKRLAAHGHHVQHSGCVLASHVSYD